MINGLLEWIEVAPPELDLRSIARGLVIAPAGCGKTQLITDAVARHESPKPILGADPYECGCRGTPGPARQGRRTAGDLPRATLDGFAIRASANISAKSGAPPRDHQWTAAHYQAIRNTAIFLLSAGHIHDILSASYDRLFVDDM